MDKLPNKTPVNQMYYLAETRITTPAHAIRAGCDHILKWNLQPLMVATVGYEIIIQRIKHELSKYNKYLKTNIYQ